MKKIIKVVLFAMTFLAINQTSAQQRNCHPGNWGGNHYQGGNYYIPPRPLFNGFGWHANFRIVPPAPIIPIYGPQQCVPMVTTGRWVKETKTETRPVEATCIGNNGTIYPCTVMKEVVTERWVYYP